MAAPSVRPARVRDAHPALNENRPGAVKGVVSNETRIDFDNRSCRSAGIPDGFNFGFSIALKRLLTRG